MAKHRRCRSSGSSANWDLIREAPLTAVEPEVACVTLPCASISASAPPCVAPGERQRAAVLADIPADALGAGARQ